MDNLRGHNLTEALMLDDGNGDVTLPFNDDQTSDDGSVTTETTANTEASAETPVVTTDETIAVDDPLAHLVPNPLTQEDELNNPTHTV